MTNVLQTAKDAINSLSNPSETQHANEWLVDFERKEIAWEVADYLLREPANTPFRFFGAKVFYSKIQKHFFQLNSSTVVASVTKTLIEHLLRLSQEYPTDMKVCRYVALAISALALQLNHDGIFNQILAWLNPIISVAPRVVLQLLVVLPEECYNSQVDVSSEIRESFSRQLTTSAGDVLSFLTFLWSAGDIDVKIQILSCLENWIRYTSLPLSVLCSSELMGHALSCFDQGDLFLDNAVDVASVIMQKYRGENLDLVRSFFNQAIKLRSRWQDKMKLFSEDDLDQDEIHICQAITRFFADLAETYIDILVSRDENMLLYQNQIMEQLLQCSQFPYDVNISRIPLKFFYELSSLIRTSIIKCEIPDNPYQQETIEITRDLIQKFSNVYLKLLETCIRQMLLPDEVLFGKSKISTETEDRRYEWRDTVIDCAEVIGLETSLLSLSNVLKTESEKGSAKKWSVIESTLYCIQQIGGRLDSNESSSAPYIVSFILSTPKDIIELTVTIINLFGRLSHWIAQNESFIPPTINYVIQTLQIPSSCIASSKSLMEIVISCSGQPSVQLESIISLTTTMRANGTLPLAADLYILEGVGSSLSKLPHEKMNPIFQALIEPLAQSLIAYINSIRTSVNASDLQNENKNSPVNSKLVSLIERLTAAFRFARMPGSTITDAFMQVFPIMNQMIELNHTNYICEKVCRFFKHSMRSCGVEFANIMEPFLNFIIQSFERFQSSSFIYIASLCVADFSQFQNGILVPILYKMIWSISNTFFIIFQAQDNSSKYLEIVEEYFHLISKAIKYSPETFAFSEKEAASIIQASLHALKLSNREVQKSVLFLYERFVQLPTTSGLSPAAVTNSNRLLQDYGYHIVHGLFLLLTCELNAYAIDEKDGCIVDVMWNMKVLHDNLFRSWIGQVSTVISTVAREEAAKMNLFEMLVNIRDKTAFIRLLDDFEWKCGRRQYK